MIVLHQNFYKLLVVGYCLCFSVQLLGQANHSISSEEASSQFVEPLWSETKISSLLLVDNKRGGASVERQEHKIATVDRSQPLPYYVIRPTQLTLNALKESDSLVHELDNLLDQLKTPSKDVIKQEEWYTAKSILSRLYASSATLLVDNNHTLPIRGLDTNKVALVHVGTRKNGSYDETVQYYTTATSYLLQPTVSSKSFSHFLDTLRHYNTVILAVYTDKIPKTSDIWKKLAMIPQEKRIVTVLGEPHKIGFNLLKESQVFLQVYENLDVTGRVVPQVLFGGLQPQGQFPYQWEEPFHKGAGLSAPLPSRLSYGLPSEVSIPTLKLHDTISHLMKYAMEQGSFPGGIILIAKDQKVIYHESFGYHTTSKRQKVKKNDLFDLASLTKVTASTLALMKLYDQGKILLNKPFSNYWTDWKNFPKKQNITLKEILAHQAGLIPYLTYQEHTMIGNQRNPEYYSAIKKSPYLLPVQKDLYLHDTIDKYIYKSINKSDIFDKKYKYSGVGFLLFPKIVKQISSYPINEFLEKSFYKPLGVKHLTYQPLENGYTTQQILPTIYHPSMPYYIPGWRNDTIHGYVHDGVAAMFGGISGNAGLFGTAHDLAKVWQMLLNNGQYGQKRYLKTSTVRTFTTTQFPENKNRRALGFDKPSLDTPRRYPTPNVTPQSFGHSGYTGTFVWVDPKHNLLYIFLTNRVYSKNYSLFNKLKTHYKIMDYVYHLVEKNS